MQITIKEAKVVKTGTNKQGEWELIAVTSQKGTQYTTFDKKAKYMGSGSIIDIGEPEEDGGKFKFKEIIEVISEIAASSSNGKEQGGYKRDTEGIEFEYKLKARLQEIDRISIEQQSAWKGVVEIIKVYPDIKLLAEDRKALDTLIRKALAWAEVRFDAKLAPTLKTASKEASKLAPGPEEPEVVDPLQPFKNVGQFLQWCIDDHSLTRTQVLEIVGCKASELSNLDLVHAHGAIEDWLKVNKPE